MADDTDEFDEVADAESSRPDDPRDESGEEPVPTDFEVDDPEGEPEAFEGTAPADDPRDVEGELDPASDQHPDEAGPASESGAVDEEFDGESEPADDDFHEPASADEQLAEEPPAGATDSNVQTSPAGYDEADVPEEAVVEGEVPADEGPAEPVEADAGAFEEAEEEELEGDDDFADEESSADFAEADGTSDNLVDDASTAEADQTDEEEAASDSAADAFVLQDVLDGLRNPPEPAEVDTEPLPDVGPYPKPATLTIHDGSGATAGTYALEAESLVVGASPPTADDEEVESDVSPDIDLSEVTSEDTPVWSRHATLYCQNKNYTLFVHAGGATQINDELVDIGTYHDLEDGDVVVVGESVGLEFNLPASDDTDGDTSDEQPSGAHGAQSADAQPIDDDASSTAEVERQPAADEMFDEGEPIDDALPPEDEAPEHADEESAEFSVVHEPDDPHTDSTSESDAAEEFADGPDEVDDASKEFGESH